MAKKISKSSLRKKLDKIFSQKVREKGRCERCGKTESLQCAHIISRKYLHTRWDFENALCMCLACHIYWAHKEPHEFVYWFDGKYGTDAYTKLRRKAESIEPIDYVSILENLNATMVTKS